MSLNVEVSKRLILVNSASAVFTRLLKLTVLAWLYQYLLRRISPDEFAVYALVMAIMVFAPLFSTLFTSGISRYVVEACARGDERRVRQIVSSIVPLLGVWAIALLALGGIFTWRINDFLNVPPAALADARLMLCLLLVDLAVQMVLTPYNAGFHVCQKFALLNVLQIGGELFRIVLLFAMMIGLNASVVWVVVASVSANFIVTLVSTALSLRMLPILRVELRLYDFRVARELLSFGLWSSVSQLAYVIYINADIIVLNKLATPLDVVNFKLGSEFYIQIQAFVTAAIGTILPALTAMHACGDARRLGDSYLRGCRYCLWIAMFVASPLILNGYQLITLYVGDTYVGAATVMVLFLLLLPLTQTIGLLAALASAKACLREFSLTGLLTQLIKLAVTIWLVRSFHLGAEGCALSTLIIIGIAVIAVYWPLGIRLAQISSARFVREVVFRGLLPALAAILSGLLLQQIHRPTTWLALAVHSATCCLIYAFVLVLICSITNEGTWFSQMRSRLGFRLALK